ncbi:MAG: MBL fold metallo-hydrolase [Candidatus Eisenbacteria bacterium]|uniref:MBL fold metallo-hydrolase n=1 Tax=Eiseniibacteriota bacterium TaxID=2212470 RepID=A0A948RTI7_UNCEI|nr:MBL fold metallo-hydrolase [Candidatus Eisenbacteria bacterium]MBU2690738.1 MBL fold metallo-hydrolase [Candidatus Eisenbacteria bacterium]
MHPSNPELQVSTARVKILASGSKGNATLIDTGDHRLLLDAGISARALNGHLAEAGLSSEEIDAILITHEHTDHIRGLRQFRKLSRATVYTAARSFAKRVSTWDDFALSTTVHSGTVHSGAVHSKVVHLTPGGCTRHGSIDIFPIPLPHDAAETVGYSLQFNGRRIVSLTDLGHLPGGLEEIISGCDLLILESNYDSTMLHNGPYPTWLKHRVDGPNGHLSNEQMTDVIRRVYNHSPENIPRHVVLAHLSENNNTPESALYAAERCLSDLGLTGKVTLHIGHQNRALDWIHLP